MNEFLEKYFEPIRDLFLKLGIKNVTMEEICAELGISKRTLYEKFSNKNQLVKEIFIMDWFRFSQELISINCKNTNAICATFSLFNLIYKKQKSWSVIVVSDLKKYQSQLINKNLSLVHKGIDQKLNEILTLGIDQKDFREDIQKIEVCSVIMYVLSSFIPMTHFYPYKSMSIFSVEAFLNYHFHSICTKQGLLRWEKMKEQLKATTFMQF